MDYQEPPLEPLLARFLREGTEILAACPESEARHLGRTSMHKSAALAFDASGLGIGGLVQ